MTHGDLLQEVLHTTHLTLHKLVEETHELLFGTEFGKIGETLADFSDESEVPGGLFLWKFLGEVKEGRGEDGRAQEAQEDTCADQIVSHLRAFALFAGLAETCKHFLEFTENRIE